MKSRRIIFFLFNSLFLFIGCGTTEKTLVDCYSIERFKRLSLPKFEAHVINLKPSDTLQNSQISRFDIYTQIAWNKIRFIKQGDFFEANYTLSFNVNKNDSLVVSKEINLQPRTFNYEATQLSINDFNLQTFHIDSGKYKIQIQITDNISGLKYRTQFLAEARNFNSTATLSNGLLLEASNGKLKPLFLNDIRFRADRDTLVYYQELYNVNSLDPIKVVSEFKVRQPMKLSSEKSRSFYYPDSAACGLPFDTTLQKHERIITPTSEKRIQLIDTFIVPLQQQYYFQRSVVYSKSKNIKDTLITSGLMNINDNYFPQLSNLEDSLTVTKYILFNYEWDSLSAQKTNSEKRNWLTSWWQKHGGISKKNEFYERAKDANLLFTSCDAGFRLPMGVVFIVSGYPNNIECQGLNNEMWQYILNNQNFYFNFRKSGTDEKTSFYNLQPFSMDENFWRYSIEQWRKK